MNVFDEDCGRDALSEATRLGVRTPAGERVLEPGEVVFFPAFAANHTSPEVVGYPGSGKVLALSQLGPLWSMHRRDDAVDYFEGGQPRL